MEDLPHSERRRSRRYAAGESQTALVSVYPALERSLPARIVNISEGGMRLRLGEPLAVNSLVQVETDGFKYLGEVVYCCAQEDVHFAGVHVEHAIDKEEIRRIAERLKRPPE